MLSDKVSRKSFLPMETGDKLSTATRMTTRYSLESSEGHSEHGHRSWERSWQVNIPRECRRNHDACMSQVLEYSVVGGGLLPGN
jgi:hypothetical protein